jgi:hypothetical protein
MCKYIMLVHGSFHFTMFLLIFLYVLLGWVFHKGELDSWATISIIGRAPIGAALQLKFDPHKTEERCNLCIGLGFTRSKVFERKIILQV